MSRRLPASWTPAPFSKARREGARSFRLTQRHGVLAKTSMDIYASTRILDDVCFSLGFALVSRRPRGAALTICPTTAYVPLRPGAPAPSAERVTAIRMAEDREFCQACGFEARFLDLPDLVAPRSRPVRSEPGRREYGKDWRAIDRGALRLRRTGPARDPAVALLSRRHWRSCRPRRDPRRGHDPGTIERLSWRAIASPSP